MKVNVVGEAGYQVRFFFFPHPSPLLLQPKNSTKHTISSQSLNTDSAHNLTT